MDILILVAVILLLLWGAGMVFAIGGELIHILLVIALIVIVIRLIQGRRIVP